MNIRLIKHEVVPGCGSYEVRFPDGRPSRYFYFEDVPGRRLRRGLVDRTVAEQEARRFARAEQDQVAHKKAHISHQFSEVAQVADVKEGNAKRI